MLNYSLDHGKTKTEHDFKNPSRGRTSTIPRLPERFSGQDSSRLAGGAGPGRGEQVGQQGREEESGATGGEETDRSTSTALTSAGWSTNLEGPLEPCKPSYSFAKHNSLTLPLQINLTGTSTDRHSYASWKSSGGHHRTSNQINQKRRKQKTDYENLILLQKIQNVKPSRSVMTSFAY